jgi:tetratricopeptide (TPR) repeat protein
MELGTAYRLKGDLPRAAQSMRAAIAAYERLYGPDHHDVAFLRLNLAIVLFQQLRLAEAEAYFRSAIAIQEKYPLQRVRAVAFYRLQLAQLLAARGKHAEAFAMLDAVERLRTGATDGYGLTPRQVQVIRGLTRLGQGDVDRGMPELQSAFTDPAAFPPRTIVSMPVLHDYLARGYLLGGDIRRARAEIDAARTLAAKEGISPARGLGIALRDAEIMAREGQQEAAVAAIASATKRAGVAAEYAETQAQIALVRGRVALVGGRFDEVGRILEPWLAAPLDAGVELPVATRGEMQLLTGEAMLARQPAAARTRLLEAEASLKASEVEGSPRLARVRAALARFAG